MISKPEDKPYLTSSREYSTFDIVKALDIDRERLREWMNRGYIKPSQPAQGQGTKAVFTKIDIYGIALFQNFIEAGFSREAASLYVQKFIKEEKRMKSETKVIVFRLSTETIQFSQLDSNSSIENLDLRTGTLVAPMSRAEKREFLPKDLEDWDRVYIVNFEKIRKKVDAALADKL
jgi:hypothetical protein